MAGMAMMGRNQSKWRPNSAAPMNNNPMGVQNVMQPTAPPMAPRPFAPQPVAPNPLPSANPGYGPPATTGGGPPTGNPPASNVPAVRPPGPPAVRPPGGPPAIPVGPALGVTVSPAPSRGMVDRFAQTPYGQAAGMTPRPQPPAPLSPQQVPKMNTAPVQDAVGPNAPLPPVQANRSVAPENQRPVIADEVRAGIEQRQAERDARGGRAFNPDQFSQTHFVDRNGNVQARLSDSERPQWGGSNWDYSFTSTGMRNGTPLAPGQQSGGQASRPYEPPPRSTRNDPNRGLGGATMSGFSNRQDLLRRSWEAGNDPALRSQAFDGATNEEAGILQGQERAHANPQIGIASRQAAADWRIAKSRGVRGVDFKEWRARRAAEMAQLNGSSNANQNSSGQPNPAQTPPVQPSNPNDPTAYGANPLGSLATWAYKGLFGGQNQAPSVQQSPTPAPQAPQFPGSGVLSPPNIPKLNMAPVPEAVGQTPSPSPAVSPNPMGGSGQNSPQAYSQQPFRMPPWGALVAGGAPGAIYSGLQGYGAVDGYFNGYSQQPQSEQPDQGPNDNGMLPYGRPPLGSYLNKLWRSARGR